MKIFFTALNKLFFLSLFLLTFIFQSLLSGCASYSDQINQAETALVSGDYETARVSLKSKLKPVGDDALLYYLELGMIEHLAGEYQASNQALSEAEDIFEYLYTQKVQDVLKVLMTNPRSGPYRGKDYERVLLHYVKALNYFALSDQASSRSKREQLVESAGVESRRADIILKDIEGQKGTYKEAKDEEGKLFSKLVRIFEVLNGEYINRDKLVFRQDAWMNYMNGISYEKNGEWDNARISYQRAAEIYAAGYTEQYKLSPLIEKQAWRDAVRMMIKGGWPRLEWLEIAQEHLTELEIVKLETNINKASVLVIEDVGISPGIKEMNLMMSIFGTNLRLQPVLTGNIQERSDQAAWFMMLYADLGLIQMVNNYKRGGAVGVVDGVFSTKNFGIAPIYPLAKQLGLVSALEEQPVRVTVPYMPALNAQQYPPTYLEVNGQSYQLDKSESVAKLALYDLILNANKEIQWAVTREAVKAVIAHKTVNAAAKQSQQVNQFKSILSLAANIVSASLSKAETRSWYFLPFEMRMKRINLEPGKHRLRLSGGSQTEVELELDAGETYIWKTRKF